MFQLFTEYYAFLLVSLSLSLSDILADVLNASHYIDSFELLESRPIS